MVLCRGKTVGRPRAGRAALWIALCLFGAAGGARAEYAQWCGPPDVRDDVKERVLTISQDVFWPAWLRDVGRNAEERGGNELLVLPQAPLTGARPVIYLSGPAPWEKTLKSALLCRTLVHVVLGAESQGNRLIANHLIFGRLLYERLRRGMGIEAIRGECSDALASPALLDRSSACPASCSICRVVHAFKNCTPLAAADTLKDEVAKNLTFILRSVDYQAKLHAYLHKSATYLGTQNDDTVPGLFSAGRTASVDKASHTEILLIHDNGGRLQPGTVVLSRYSMCKNCEPAVVQAARNNQVWFISRCVYNQSYIAGRTNAPVKKAVVYPDGEAVPVADLWTAEEGPYALLDAPNDTTVFGGTTWLAMREPTASPTAE